MGLLLDLVGMFCLLVAVDFGLLVGGIWWLVGDLVG